MIGAIQLRIVGVLAALTLIGAPLLLVWFLRAPGHSLHLHGWDYWSLLLGHRPSAAVEPTFGLTVTMARIILLGTIFASLSSLTYLTLNVHKQFALPALGDLASKLTILVVGVGLSYGLATRPGNPVILGFAIAMAAAALTRLGVHLVALRGKLRLVQRGVDWSSPALRRVGVLMLPLVIGVVAAQVVRPWNDAFFTSQLPGGLVALKTARRITDPLVQIFPVALGIAFFPFLADLAARGNLRGLGEVAMRGLRVVAFAFLPLAVGVLMVGPPAIRLLFEHGKFTPTDTAYTVSALNWYAIGMIFLGAEQVVLQVYYAMSDTRTPVAFGLMGIGLHLLLSWAGITYLAKGGGAHPLMGFAVIAAAYALSKALKVIVLLLLMPRHVAEVPWEEGALLFGKLLIACAGMAAAIWLVQQLGASVFAHGLHGRILAVLAPTAAAVVVFALAAWALRIEEARLVWNALRRRR